MNTRAQRRVGFRRHLGRLVLVSGVAYALARWVWPEVVRAQGGGIEPDLRRLVGAWDGYGEGGDAAGRTGEAMSAQAERRHEFRLYLTGFALAVGLTGLAFALVLWAGLDAWMAVTVLSLLALVQIAVHFRFFLHIDLQRSHRDDLQLILFSGLIVVLMVAGSLWITWNQMMRMR